MLRTEMGIAPERHDDERRDGRSDDDGDVQPETPPALNASLCQPLRVNQVVVVEDAALPARRPRRLPSVDVRSLLSWAAKNTERHHIRATRLA
ncbi:MAG TPA: hypothetical protein VFA70_10865 [Dehalococcoidia bacterium]|jgi:hypothetical protein|nr:hypothetical protein [Dehalococcoidia bacterium]